MKTQSQKPAANDNRPRTVAEARQFLGIGKTLFWRMVGEGSLRVIRISDRTVRVPVSELNRIAEQGTRRRERRTGRVARV
jgi:predicted site-specific integrase-resolvase